jgi:hypothetical protein
MTTTDYTVPGLLGSLARTVVQNLQMYLQRVSAAEDLESEVEGHRTLSVCHLLSQQQNEPDIHTAAGDKKSAAMRRGITSAACVQRSVTGDSRTLRNFPDKVEALGRVTPLRDANYSR